MIGLDIFGIVEGLGNKIVNFVKMLCLTVLHDITCVTIMDSSKKFKQKLPT